MTAEFAASLRALRERAGDPTAQNLIARAGTATLSRSALSEWFRGKAVPAEQRKIEVLIRVLAELAVARGAAVAPEEHTRLRRLYRAARGERRALRGARPDQSEVLSSGQPLTCEEPVSLLSAPFGNVCAHPDCRNPLIGTRLGEERFVGAVVHIGRGAEDGNTSVATSLKQINAESNVVLLCAEHQRELTEKPEKWPLNRLQEIRENALRTHAVGLRRHLPKLMALNYANLERLAHIAVFQGQNVTLPQGGPVREIQSTNSWLQTVMDALDHVQLETRRMTHDFDLRTLQPADLLVFDRQVRTLHGVHPSATSTTLTANLDLDPLIYIERRGVRVVMPLNPDFITTSSAFIDFGAGVIRLAGLCLIKRPMYPDEPPTWKRRPKKQFLATPLLLGLAQWDQRDADLSERNVFEEYDPETGEHSWNGPWNLVTEDDESA